MLKTANLLRITPKGSCLPSFHGSHMTCLLFSASRDAVYSCFPLIFFRRSKAKPKPIALKALLSNVLSELEDNTACFCGWVMWKEYINSLNGASNDLIRGYYIPLKPPIIFALKKATPIYFGVTFG